ncbi:MAG: rubrerythrin family protein [Bacillota bacterium]
MQDLEKKLKGTKTETNLRTAYSGESQARTKYEFYEAQAKKDGYVQIAQFFKETADNEKAHAKIWFKILHDGNVPKTPENLKDGAAGEHYEWSDMYKEFAQEAREENFMHIATLFDGVAAIEKAHEERYRELLQNINEGKVFKREEMKTWQCQHCGHTHTGMEAPMVCPVCTHPQAYFQIVVKDY